MSESNDPPKPQPSETSEPPRTAHPTSSAELLRTLSQPAGSARYSVKGEIARGGMGAIHKVWDTDLRRHLAMKVLLETDHKQPTDPKEEERAAKRLARFLEEAQVTGQLDHPGIVPVHELGVDSSGRVYFTMRLVRGRDFQQILELTAAGKEGWTQTRALHTLQRVCEAMAFAHSRGVIHRDLKPANIMVGGFGEVYVMDWGLARVRGAADLKPDPTESAKPMTTSEMPAERKSVKAGEGSRVRTIRQDATQHTPLHTLDGEVVGTPSYMSPEQAHGKTTELGPQADVYSVGAILYQLLSGTMPYVDPGKQSSPYMILAAVKDGPPKRVTELNRDLPGELVSICERAMARDPAQRYPDMRAMAEDLRAFLENRVVKAHATGAFAEFRKWVARNKATAAALAAALGAVVLGLAGIAHQQSERTREVMQKNDLLESAKAEIEKKQSALVQTNDQLRSETERAKKAEKLAVENEDTARKEAERAQRALADYQQLADAKRLADLREKAEQVLEKTPPPLDVLQQWNRDAAVLAALRDARASKLDELRKELATSAGTDGGDERMQLRWKMQVLEEFVRGLDEIRDRRGLAARVDAAVALWESTTGPNSGWDAAAASIADAAQSPAYRGLRIAPQYGLRPLRKDPKSGLWEFHHVLSGAAPQADARGGWRIGKDTGIVLVLVPPGTFTMGAAPPDPQHPAGAPNVDKSATAEEGPPRPVALDAYFISKYELTRAQWLRLTGENGKNGDADATASLPVASVSWEMAKERLKAVGLVLPTEAQWECAARGGTATDWWTGDESESLRGAENLGWDGFGRNPVLAVGSLRANPFGLFDMLGNVEEWCADEWRAYDAKPASSQRSDATIQLNYVARGGCFEKGVVEARSARRDSGPASFRIHYLGVRPARAVTGSSESSPR